MKRNRSNTRWILPALLAAGIAWGGTAHAQRGDDRFDGPGGMSAPAPLEKDGREGRGEKRMRGGHERRMGRMEGRGGKHGRMGMHGKMGRHGGRGGMRGGALFQGLDLSDAQKEKMASLHEAQQRRMIPIRSGLAEAQLDLQKLMRADAPRKAEIDAAIDRMARLRADAQKARVATMLEAHTILTPEQRKQMKERHGGMGRGMRGMQGMGHGFGGGGRGGHHGDEI